VGFNKILLITRLFCLSYITEEWVVAALSATKVYITATKKIIPHGN